MGESYTICDPYLFTPAQWLEADGVDPTRFPRVLDHRARMAEREESARCGAWWRELGPQDYEGGE